MENLEHIECWKAITLFGLNTATYKPALSLRLLEAAKNGRTILDWAELSESFLDLYITRLANSEMPQQSTLGRQTKIERLIKRLDLGDISKAQAIDIVARNGFVDVVPRFHTIGNDPNLLANRFYEAEFGKEIILKDSLCQLGEAHFNELASDAEARWSMLEGAFEINHTNFDLSLANDIREFYLKSAYARKSLSHLVSFLPSYQANVCFYCGAPMTEVHVDHLLPRQVLQHDQVWNLVLAHKQCNLLKGDAVVSSHIVEKLVQRNENIMGGNHPCRAQIQADIGSTPRKRAAEINKHYENVKAVLGQRFWGGSERYNPATDPFYTMLITKLNGG